MRWFKYVALLAILAVPAIYAQAQVSIGVQIGPDYGYYNAPPVCAYGYYPDYPFGCAPYGYWGPDYFADGVFIGVGPWDHFYYRHPEIYERYGLFRRFHDRDDFRGERFRDRDGFRGERFHDRDDFRRGRDFHGGEAVRVERFRDHGDFHGDRGFRGNESFRGGRDGGGHQRAEFHGGGNFRGGESHGGGEHHGGDHGGRR